MAEKQFFYNALVSITENYATNFFDISEITMETQSGFTTASKEQALEMITEQEKIYNEIQLFCDKNIDEKDIFRFTQNLEELLNAVQPKYLTKIFFKISNIDNINYVYLDRSFMFPN